MTAGERIPHIKLVHPVKLNHIISLVLGRRCRTNLARRADPSGRPRLHLALEFTLSRREMVGSIWPWAEAAALASSPRPAEAQYPIVPATSRLAPFSASLGQFDQGFEHA